VPGGISRSQGVGKVGSSGVGWRCRGEVVEWARLVRLIMTVLYAQHDRLELSRARVRGFPDRCPRRACRGGQPYAGRGLARNVGGGARSAQSARTRYRLVTVLAVSVAAVLAGACSYVAIAE
jgi:hypothetical protein